VSTSISLRTCVAVRFLGVDATALDRRLFFCDYRSVSGQEAAGEMTKKLRNAFLKPLFGFLLLVLVGCEVATSIRLGVGPSFSFDGSGRLVFFRVYGPRLGHKIATPVDDQSLMWGIALTNDSPSGALVTGMQIVYGKVPKGYVQKFPSSGGHLPLLTDRFMSLMLRLPGRRA